MLKLILHTPSAVFVAALASLIALAACGGAGSTPASSAPPSSAASVASKATTASSASAAAKTSSAAPASASAATAKASSAAAKSQPAKTLNVTYGGPTATLAPLWMADAIHAFEKHGLAVKINSVASAALTPAMLNKEIDMAAVSGAGVLTADLNAELDEVYIGAVLNYNTATLYTQKDIKTPADLKGKQVSSDQPGTPGDFFAHQLLSKIGLKNSDVVIRRLGGSSISVPAFIAGQVQAVGTVAPYSYQLDSKGYPALTTIVGDPYLNIGFVVLRSRLDELAPVLPGFLLAIREGIQAYGEQPDLAKQVIQKFTKEDDPDVLQKTYDSYKTKTPFDPSLEPKAEGLQVMLDYLGDTTIPKAKNAKPSQFVDLRFVSQLPKT